MDLRQQRRKELAGRKEIPKYRFQHTSQETKKSPNTGCQLNWKWKKAVAETEETKNTRTGRIRVQISKRSLKSESVAELELIILV